MEGHFACAEEDSASTEGSCTGTEEDNFDAAEQELDEESVTVQKEVGWISPSDLERTDDRSHYQTVHICFDIIGTF